MMSGAYDEVIDKSPQPNEQSQDTTHPLNYTFGQRPSTTFQPSAIPGRDTFNALQGVVKNIFQKSPLPDQALSPANSLEWAKGMAGLGGGAEEKLISNAPELWNASTTVAKGATNLFRPGLASQQFVKNLGGGTAEQNISNLAGKIQDAHDTNLAEALATKKDVMDKTANEGNMYQTIDPYSYQSSEYATNPRISRYYKDDALEGIDNPNVIDAHEKFQANQTFANADNLQSEIGKRIGYLQRQSRQYQLDSQGFQELKTLSKAQGNINADQTNFLKSIDPKLNDQYDAFKEQYKNNVVPYYSSDLLRNITRDRATTGITPAQIKTEFAFPDSDASKVATDIGETGRNNILYNELNSKGINPTDSTGIRNMMNEMKQKGGYQQYVTPELESTMNSWKTKENARQGLGYGAGIAGLATGHPLVGGLAATYFSGKPLLQKLMEMKGIHIK